MGALLWGAAADLVGTQWALGAAAALMGSAAVGFLRHGLHPSEGIEPDPADAVAPSLGGGALPEGAIRVEITYVPSAGQATAFLDAVASLRLSRLRLGAAAGSCWSTRPGRASTSRPSRSPRGPTTWPPRRCG